MRSAEELIDAANALAKVLRTKTTIPVMIGGPVIPAHHPTDKQALFVLACIIWVLGDDAGDEAKAQSVIDIDAIIQSARRIGAHGSN